ncbi:MAG: hypothetical protein GY823_03905 [Flavobacteriaceae bacterium]|nr:hypothetical protein [Flavobacteriaceae bacterium]
MQSGNISIKVNNIKTNDEKIDEEILKNKKNKFKDYKELFDDTFIYDLASIMSRYFLPVYLSSLIIAYFYCTESYQVERSETAINVFDISNRIFACYMIVVVLLGFLWPIVSSSYAVNLGIIGSTAQSLAFICLIFAYVILFNLFLTAFSHFYTYLMVLNKQDSNEQSFIRVLFDTRMVRRPLTRSIFGRVFEGTIFGQAGDILDNTSSNIFSTTWDAVTSSISGSKCSNSWGGNNNSLLWQPVNISFTENVIGKFSWWLEEQFIRNRDTLEGCTLLYYVRFFTNYLSGISTSDAFFANVITYSIPETKRTFNVNTKFALEFMKSKGIACNGQDFAYYIEQLKDFDKRDDYENLFKTTAILNGANKRNGLPKRLNEVDLNLEKLLQSDRDFLQSEINLFYDKLNQRLTEERKVDFYIKNRADFIGIGFNLKYLEDALKQGKIKISDTITQEHAKAMIGYATELYGKNIRTDIITQDKIMRSLRLFGDFDCSMGKSVSALNSCCNVETRPYQLDKGYEISTENNARFNIKP